MATIQGISPYYLNRDIRSDVATRVQVKDEWTDGWQTIPYLDAVSATTCVAPGIGNARLVYNYGKIIHAGNVFFNYDGPIEIIGKLVKISTVSTAMSGSRVLWTGVITSESTQPHGTRAGIQSGVQHFQAAEMSHFLNRQALTWSYFERTAGNGVGPIGNLPTYNRQPKFGLSVLGNRSDDKMTLAYVFSADGSIWSNLDIIENLLVSHAPEGMTFKITGQYSVLDSITEVFQFEDSSLFSALNSLVDRHRGIGWNLIDRDNGKFDFDVFTFLDESVSVGNMVVPKNENVIDNIYISDDRGVKATITYTDEAHVDIIEVIGDKIISCFTVSPLEGTLEKAWTAAEQTSYKSPVSSDNAISDAERQNDEHERVFQAFRIPKTWDGRGDSAVTGVHHVALPRVNDDGTIDVIYPAEMFFNEKSLQRSIPLLKPAAIAGAVPEYLPPLVVLYDEAKSRFVQTESAGANVRMTDGELGIIVTPSINHILAFAHFNTSSEGSDIEPLYNYTKMVATVALETDERLRVVAKTKTYGNTKTPKTITINVRDASLWYLTPGTMTGIANGVILRNIIGEVIRDDSERLRQIAALAISWYGKQRSIIDLSWKRITNAGVLGSLIRSVNDSWHRIIAGTVITSISWDFEHQETSINTSFAEVDFGSFQQRTHSYTSRYLEATQRITDRYLANLNCRTKGGSGAGDTIERFVWNEDTTE